jgi:hypothetical protein
METARVPENLPTPANVIFVVLCLFIFGLAAFAKFIETAGAEATRQQGGENLFSSCGSLAILLAIRRASSSVCSLVAERPINKVY